MNETEVMSVPDGEAAQESAVPAEIGNENTEAAETDERSAAEQFYGRVKALKAERAARVEKLLDNAAERLGVQRGNLEELERAVNTDFALRSINGNIGRRLSRWKNDSEAVKELYPQFDLDECLKNREFFSLCYRGVGLREAYELTHRDEVLSAAMAYAVNELRKTGMLSQHAVREAEGALKQNSAELRADTKGLTKKQRSDLIRRAERGERITFN